MHPKGKALLNLFQKNYKDLVQACVKVTKQMDIDLNNIDKILATRSFNLPQAHSVLDYYKTTEREGGHSVLEKR
jgi:hypothetical protein